jgi:hypothetical protein
MVDENDWQTSEPALRTLDAEAAREAERRRARRLPPIRRDRPWGSYPGSLLFFVIAAACAALLLYDLGVIWQPEPREAEGVVTLVADRPDPRADPRGLYHLAVAYGGDESLLTVNAIPRPVLGDHLTVVTHSRYGSQHVQSVRVVGTTDRAWVYLEHEHGFSVNGGIAIVGVIVFGSVGVAQARLAYSQRRRYREQGKRAGRS